MQDHRIPPQNLEAEQSVLGGLMLEQNAWDEVADLISEDDFYKPGHRKIFSAIKQLNHKNQPTDLVTVSNELLASKELDASGGPAYLAELIDQTPSAAHIQSYAKIVHEKSLLRRIISVSQGFIEKSFGQGFQDINSFLDQCEAEMFSVAERRSMQGLVDSSELVKASLDRLEALYAKKLDVIGIPTGFNELDDMTSGFHAGELVIVAARPSMGKTAFSLNIALQAAVREKKSVAYFSVEMPKEQLMIRMLASEARIPLGHLRVGQIDDPAWPKLINTAARLSESPIFVDDTSSISPYEIRAKARRLKAKSGLDMIIVDYLQLMSLKQKAESRQVEVSEISRSLKALAKELQIPVIALAQLNRGVEGRSDRRPMLADLRESGSIEQDADVIMMLYREDYYDRDNPEIRGVSEVIVGKQRNGPTGMVKLRWQPQFGLFLNNDQALPTAPLPPEPLRSVPPPAASRPRNFAPGADHSL